MLQSINNVKNYLNSMFVERESQVTSILTTLIAGENCLLLGGAGVAKSALINELSMCISSAKYFQWLLTRFTVPEELFGALSLKELELGVYKRNVSGKLPDAHVAFVDEVFKASSAILNTLLTIINEKVFHNNGTPIPCPLISLFGASNELPEEDEGLDPLYDRFVCRLWVREVTDDGFTQVLSGIHKTRAMLRPSIQLSDILALQEEAEKVIIPPDVLETVRTIRSELRNEGINPSTRRFVKSMKLVQAYAVLDGATQADFTHLEVLKDTLWDKEEQINKVSSIVQRYCTDLFTQQLLNYLSMAQEIHDNAIKEGSTEAGTEANKKAKEILNDLAKIKLENPLREAVVEVTENRIKELNKHVLSVCLAI